MAPIEALIKRAEGLNKRLDADTKSEVDSLDVALEMMKKRLGRAK